MIQSMFFSNQDDEGGSRGASSSSSTTTTRARTQNDYSMGGASGSRDMDLDSAQSLVRFLCFSSLRPDLMQVRICVGCTSICSTCHSRFIFQTDSIETTSQPNFYRSCSSSILRFRFTTTSTRRRRRKWRGRNARRWRK